MPIFRILAIDYGETRVGLALSDPLQIISSPYKVIKNDENLIAVINDIIKEKDVGKVVLGLPYNLKGEYSQKTTEVKEFGDKLETTLSVPLEYMDERYSTVEANEELKRMGYSIKDARKVVDKIAASIILKTYLNI